jgi:hypothetical protein
MGKASSVDSIYNSHLFGVQGTNTTINNSKTYELRIEQMIMGKLIELCANRFKWVGLPPEIDERFLELTLFYQGLAIWYRSEDYDKHFILRGAGMGVDIYNNPLSFNVVNRGASLIPRIIGKNDCVPIWSNYLRTSEIETVLIYSRRLARLDRTIEINTDNARQPRILAANQNTQLSMENLNRQLDEGVPVLKVRDNMDPTAIAQALDMGVDADLFDKLGIMRNRVWNECMSMLGIKNANQDKKERLVADEVSANDQQVDFMRAVNLNARQAAAESINAMYNLSVSVDYDDDITRNEV